MHLRYILYTLVIATIFSATINGQTLDDALRYSSIDRVGTARGMAMGGSLGALGGEFGVTMTNPASLGSYKWNEFQLTPGFFLSNASSELIGAANNMTSEDRNRFIFPSVSYVQVNDRLSKGQSRLVYGLGLNRVANYNRKYLLEGEQANSITQYFIQESNGIVPEALPNVSAFLADLAYVAFVTSYDEGLGIYTADVAANDRVQKSQLISQKGSMNELNFTVAMDYENKFQWGASVGAPFVYYREKKEYRETAPGHPVFNELQFDENLTTRGSGINFKAGAKIVLGKKLHLSVAAHSPTWLRLEDEFDARVNYQYIFDANLFPSPGPRESLSPEGLFTYQFRTPWRAMGGLAYQIGRVGVFTSEVEFVDFASSRFTMEDDPTYAAQLNDNIDDEFTSALNIRGGVEFRLGKFARVRGGFGLEQSGLKNSAVDDPMYWSIGGGYWFGNHYYIDIAYKNRSVDQRYSPYTLNNGNSPVLASTFNEHSFALTLGSRF